nr:AAA family ATPase [Paracoccus saliphilus]
MDDAPTLLTCPSFATVPARHQLYLSASYRDTIAMIGAWSNGDRALLILSGPSGSGKTVLASELAETSSGSMRVGWISLDRPDVDLALEVPKAFGIGSSEPLKELARLLADCRRTRRKCLLIVDNAHLLSNLSKEFLDELADAPGLPLPMYVLLVGRGEVGALMEAPTPDELRGKIGGHLRLEPFNAAETADYIAHRFRVGKCPCHDGVQPFDTGGLWLLHAASGGYPGTIDLLVRHCLSKARSAGNVRLGKTFVHSCLAELAEAEGLPYPLPDVPRDDHDLAAPPIVALAAGPDTAVGRVHAQRRSIRPHRMVHPDYPRARRWLKPGLTGAAVAALFVLSSNLMTLSDDLQDRLPEALSQVIDEPVQDFGSNAVALPGMAMTQLETIVERSTPDPQDLLIRALALGTDDPEAAIPIYTQAALWGSERAAYYLGQLYETGIGVEADLNRARAWYLKAPQITAAVTRLRQMEEAPTLAADGELAPPVPERQVIYQSGRSELHWRGPSGPDPARYRVEFVTAGAERVQELETGLSAALIPLPVSRWRVLALRPDGTPAAASTWAILDPGTL